MFIVPAALGLCVVYGVACARETASSGNDDEATSQTPVGPQDSSDAGCLQALQEKGVLFERLAPMELVQTPILVKGAIGSLMLKPRGRRTAIMDCSLALGLSDAAWVFEALGLTQLAFSAAHDHRTRLGSSQLSSHALGTAIDVHSFDGAAGLHDVAKDFEMDVGRWKGIAPGPGALQSCVGTPATDKGRALRMLACRLKLETSFRIIVTPDDNADHRDHLHLEHAPFGRAAVPPATPSALPPRAAPARSAAPSAAPVAAQPRKRLATSKHKRRQRKPTKATTTRKKAPAKATKVKAKTKASSGARKRQSRPQPILRF